MKIRVKTTKHLANYADISQISRHVFMMLQFCRMFTTLMELSSTGSIPFGEPENQRDLFVMFLEKASLSDPHRLFMRMRI
jgi:hypothetical protein